MSKRLQQLQREASRWGLELGVIEGDPMVYTLGYPQGAAPFKSPSLATIRNLLWAHRHALSGHRKEAAA
jgi:hypothetical protein